MSGIRTADDFAPNPAETPQPINDPQEAHGWQPGSGLPPPADVPSPPTTKHVSDDDPTGQTSDSNTVKANFEGKEPGPGTIRNEDTVGRRAGQDKYEGVDYEHRKKADEKK